MEDYVWDRKHFCWPFRRHGKIMGFLPFLCYGCFCCTDLRAYVMSGGGIALKKFKPSLRSKRCFLMFPIRSSERKGLVSVEVKKKKGQYDMKLLAVDIPMASGPDQRLFLIGDEEEYRVGGGLISDLRDPVVKAMSATKEFDDLDEIEEEEDAERELQEAERKHQEEIEKLEKGVCRGCWDFDNSWIWMWFKLHSTLHLHQIQFS
ncbi:Import inner membrane translocase subunit [Quillaja saponaria]|uniref:Import inner membrane translocase subunit n=1 Tax=Quillaja saponaria TaxID=32244 RepID=A0AAD7PLH2_QUISA|nr:Import inner membrane translocase subunit [Quillaja saponaria]